MPAVKPPDDEPEESGSPHIRVAAEYIPIRSGTARWTPNSTRPLPRGV